MGRIVIVVYRPKQGKELELLKLVGEHVSILRAEGLVTDRKPIIMRAEDRCVVEVFEWKSAEAIKLAHANDSVGKLWARFTELCDYEAPTNVKEFQTLFSEFESID